MSDDDARPQSVRDVLSLSTTLAERMLHTCSTGHVPSKSDFEAVVKAAEFLQAHKAPWPAVVTEVIDLLVTQMEAIRAATGDA